MHRYDWGWNRGYGRPDRAPYDRLYRSGDGVRGGPRGPYFQPEPGWGGYGGYDRYAGYGSGPDYGYGGYGEFGGRGRFSRRERPWVPRYDRGYRYSYPGSFTGGRGRFGRQEPWEPGPPSGYGSEWARAYGDASQRRGGAGDYDGVRYSRGRYAGPASGEMGGWASYAQEWDFPPGYVDEGIQDFYDDEEDEDGDPFASDEEYLEPWSAEAEDAQVRREVIRSLESDGFLTADAIQVEVKDRVVILRGEVGDYMESRYAWDDAWDAPGVRGVVSKLTVAGVAREEVPPKAKSSRSKKKQ